MSDIQGYFEYILKNTEERLNASIRIYKNEIDNRITFKIKIGYYLELITPGTMKLLRSTETKKTINENGENVPNLEITEAVLVHCQYCQQ